MFFLIAHQNSETWKGFIKNKVNFSIGPNIHIQLIIHLISGEETQNQLEWLNEITVFMLLSLPNIAIWILLVSVYIFFLNDSFLILEIPPPVYNIPPIHSCMYVEVHVHRHTHKTITHFKLEFTQVLARDTETACKFFILFFPLPPKNPTLPLIWISLLFRSLFTISFYQDFIRNVLTCTYIKLNILQNNT